MPSQSNPSHASPPVAGERAEAKGVVATLVHLGPVLFGLGFLAPLIAQSLDALGLEVPIAPSNLAFGLVVGGLGGVVAMRRGSWV